MASSTLRNDQQVKQQPAPHTGDATGTNKVVVNTQLGTGSGKVINGCTMKDAKTSMSGKRSKK